VNEHVKCFGRESTGDSGNVIGAAYIEFVQHEIAREIAQGARL
jgi:hypothetical protein